MKEVVSSRDRASLRFGVQTLEHSNMRKGRRRKWVSGTKEGFEVRTEAHKEIKEKLRGRRRRQAMLSP